MNINNLVRVKLTEHGIANMIMKNPTAMEYHFDKDTKILETELWDIMNIFGDQMYLGAKQVSADNNIEIIPE